MKSINNLLSELTEDATHSISNPDTIDKLQKLGVPFNEPKQKTLEEVTLGD